MHREVNVLNKRILVTGLMVLLILPLVACGPAEKVDLSGNRVVLFLDDGFNYEEASSSIQHLKKLGAEVVVAGVSLGKKTPYDAGAPIEVELLVRDIDAESFDGVLVPGGMPNHINALKGNSDVTVFVQAMAASGKLTAAVCAGPAVLGHARVLEGKRVIATPRMSSEAADWGASWASGNTVVEEGNIITAAGPSDMYMFNSAIVSFLAREQ